MRVSKFLLYLFLSMENIHRFIFWGRNHRYRWKRVTGPRIFIAVITVERVDNKGDEDNVERRVEAGKWPPQECTGKCYGISSTPVQKALVPDDSPSIVWLGKEKDRGRKKERKRGRETELDRFCGWAFDQKVHFYPPGSVLFSLAIEHQAGTDAVPFKVYMRVWRGKNLSSGYFSTRDLDTHSGRRDSHLSRICPRQILCRMNDSSLPITVSSSPQ